MVNAAEYVTVTEASRRLGVSGEFVRRRLRDGALIAYSNPRDGRSKLIPVDHLERFAVPRPLTTARRAGEMPSDAA
jgi:excisionase family DNA binding protein